MAKSIAVVKLSPGVIGYYDEISGLYLSMASPIGEVYDDMNYSKIKRAIMDRTLELVAGTLVPVAGFSPNDLYNKSPELIENPVEPTFLDSEEPIEENSDEPVEVEEPSEEEVSEKEITNIDSKDVKNKENK